MIYLVLPVGYLDCFSFTVCGCVRASNIVAICILEQYLFHLVPINKRAVRKLLYVSSGQIRFHYNHTSLEAIPHRITALKKHSKPVVCNEDEKVGVEGAKAAESSVANGASWGLMEVEINQHLPFEFNGARDD